MNKKTEKGFILIEFIIYMSIFGLLLGSGILFTTNSLDSLKLKNEHLTIYTLLNLARFQAKALDEDVLLSINDSNLISKAKEQTVNTYTFTTSLSISNKGEIGFTGDGNTKRSGKITLQHKDKQHHITLGVWDAPVKL